MKNLLTSAFDYISNALYGGKRLSGMSPMFG